MIDLVYNYGTTNNNGNVQSVSWSQTNGYDRYGNRWIDLGGGIQSLYFSTSNNRISGWGYDAAGNLLNDTVHSYTYDAENKISKVDNVTAYMYDGAGHRVKKLVGENTRFIYGIGGELIAEFDGATGNLKKEYVYGGATLITIEPTAVNANGTQYTTSDNLGSPRVITNSLGSVVSRHDYMPFGEEIFAGTGGRTAAMGFGVADGNRKKFTGYERDTETGLDFAQARYYSSTQGRFTSADSVLGSIANPQSLNRYAYVGNNPLRFSDPTGHLPSTSHTISSSASPNPGWGWDDSGFDPAALAVALMEEMLYQQMRELPGGELDSSSEGAAIEGHKIDEDESSAGEPQDSQSGPKVMFDAVELLDDPGAGLPQGPLKVPKPINPIRSATREQFDPNAFTLDVDDPRVAIDGLIAIRVKFHVVDGDYDKPVTVITTEKENRRWD